MLKPVFLSVLSLAFAFDINSNFCTHLLHPQCAIHEHNIGVRRQSLRLNATLRLALLLAIKQLSLIDFHDRRDFAKSAACATYIGAQTIRNRTVFAKSRLS